nr:16S rRNA (guanine(527)-N(7))-methyltransferase RsmG [Aquicoccus sp. G2-2]MEA1114711.1 16S rRNA (guanine(527)-N(7))-methyltransferase RsmG [Aquicoccus sp. G2-2]
MNVSRETFDRLHLYAELLQKWNPRINLVARSTLATLWERHILDSLQVIHLLKTPATHWADLGSGGGFPGLVVAICAVESGNPTRVTLVESDQRKAAFLRTVLRETGAKAEVIAKRIEETAPLRANILSARALSDLTTLLGLAERHLAPNATCFLHKGKNWKSELHSARAAWNFSYDTHPSSTDSEAVILQIEGLSRV